MAEAHRETSDYISSGIAKIDADIQFLIERLGDVLATLGETEAAALLPWKDGASSDEFQNAATQLGLQLEGGACGYPNMFANWLQSYGPSMGAKLIEAREAAPFRSLGDLERRVKGVGPRTIDRWRPYLRLGDEEAPGRGSPHLPNSR